MKDKFWFLGREFLTWLWFVCEKRDGHVECGELGPIGIEIEDKIELASGGNVNATATITEDAPTMAEEAHTALGVGKKLSKARFCFNLEQYGYVVTLDSDLRMSAIKLPATLDAKEATGTDQRHFVVTDRLNLLAQLEQLIETLFNIYIDKRTDPRWQSESEQMRDWVRGA